MKQMRPSILNPFLIERVVAGRHLRNDDLHCFGIDPRVQRVVSGGRHGSVLARVLP
jgi:hypothetical protein